MPLHAESGTQTRSSVAKFSEREVTAAKGNGSHDNHLLCGTITTNKINEFIGRDYEHLTSSALCSLASLLNHKTFLLL